MCQASDKFFHLFTHDHHHIGEFIHHHHDEREFFQLGRFGQVVVSSGDRLLQPTAVAEPGPAANAVQAANDLNRLIIDDAINAQNPDPIVFGRNGDELTASNTLRGGDTAESLDRIADSIREISRLEGKLDALTSQARYQASFMAMMPIIFLALLWSIDPQGVGMLFTEPAGRMILLGVTILIVTAFVWIRNIMAVEI